MVEVRDLNRYDADGRRWLAGAIAKVKADQCRSADTHLLSVPLPEAWGVDLYLKDESTHPTGSLKHRLARSLFLYALSNGWIRPGAPVVEASSGSTAISEAYFARLIGVSFITVVAATTSAEKVRLIRSYGADVRFVDDPSTVYAVAADIAQESGGHYMDQFTYAERATDWRGNNNIAESVFRQMAMERYPEPAWIVATAGTGGTSSTLGRYVRYTGRMTGLCVADPENSAFLPAWEADDRDVTTAAPSRIEGIGRQRVEPSFTGTVVDRMMGVPDAAAIGAIQALEQVTGIRAGGSTGTGLWAALRLVSEMVDAGEQGSVVSLICDSGERYLDKYYSTEWLADRGIDAAAYRDRVLEFLSADEGGQRRTRLQQ
ncbi:PLP-dependent cysteine synthase family protein [Corynebacterium sp.]|uniref:PLP-dependent cysteine synthase family protein n=1 Tax=Corynebacterium sp. TaxID=1720 RepID=UPI0028A8F70A|nr:PLP-dependent cysteine synthase family protein [Corynebacterium sp.]